MNYKPFYVFFCVRKQAFFYVFFCVRKQAFFNREEKKKLSDPEKQKK